MFGIGVPELVVVAIVFGILFFGGRKMIDFARSLGRLSGEFKKSKADIERELKESEAQAFASTSAPVASTQPSPSTTVDPK